MWIQYHPERAIDKRRKVMPVSFIRNVHLEIEFLCTRTQSQRRVEKRKFTRLSSGISAAGDSFCKPQRFQVYMELELSRLLDPIFILEAGGLVLRLGWHERIVSSKLFIIFWWFIAANSELGVISLKLDTELSSRTQNERTHWERTERERELTVDSPLFFEVLKVKWAEK